MGIKYFVFAVNKMDLVGYSQERFEEIEKEIHALASELNLENVKIIPLSATVGDNVTTKSTNTAWYTGEPLLEYLENVDVTNQNVEQGFYMPVQRVSRPNHTFRGFQGQIESGAIAVGDEVTVLPSNEKALVKGILVSGNESDNAFVGQAVTIQLDKEVDVSRGCVLTANTDIAVSKHLNTTILWTDDEKLSVGKEYLIKLGTKLITGVLSKIDYTINVNTGEHQPADTLSKNEIAYCEIILTEPIVVDKFKKHKTLGEFILIDRITNMTSACGVVEDFQVDESSSKERASFKNGNVVARGDIFEEFYYDVNSLSVLKYQPVSKTYTIGDEIPTTGESYAYPDTFDVIVLRDKVAIKVRDKKILDIVPFSEYQYSGVRVINGRGFEVLVKSQEELQALLDEYEAITVQNEKDFYAKWLKFDTYRKISF
jgi:sulfate adenylyltransferase subunit 1